MLEIVFDEDLPESARVGAHGRAAARVHVLRETLQTKVAPAAARAQAYGRATLQVRSARV